jgi:hypothetical protein
LGFFLLLLLPKANSQPKGLAAIQSQCQKQLLRITNLKAPFPLLSPAFGSNNYPPATGYEEENGLFYFIPSLGIRPIELLVTATVSPTARRPHPSSSPDGRCPHLPSSPVDCRSHLPSSLVDRRPQPPELVGRPPPPTSRVPGPIAAPTFRARRPAARPPPLELARRPLLHRAPLPYGVGGGPQQR